MVYAGILAGGYGWDQTRKDMPKQFFLIGTKPIIIHTTEQFVINPQVEKIIVVVPENWVVYAKDLFKKANYGKEIIVISGGNNKNHSIKKIVEYIDLNYGIDASDILINHDAIRPFVTQRIIDENIRSIKNYDSASTAVPTIDTIIKANEYKEIIEITSKKVFYSEQTPQTFKLEKLHKTYKNEKLAFKYVNAIRMFMEDGNSVRLVNGEYSNIKIVTQYDLEVANAILKEKLDDK